MSKKTPRLRTVEKVKPPFPLNKFPKDFAYKLGGEIVYLLATKQRPVLEGPEWELIFANCIGADWKPSNVGLDDVVLGNCAWCAKSVKQKAPINSKKVRLISGRNAPSYSFGEFRIGDYHSKPDDLGDMILKIWNGRVSGVRRHYSHLRTVVIMKSELLDEVGVFEFDTIRYEPELYFWKWNKSGNLQGYAKDGESHQFTWQPSGSQFTVIEDVPKNVLIVRVKVPKKINKNIILKSIGYSRKWVSIVKRHD